MKEFPFIMLNPGDLQQAHQDLKDKCFSCHEPFLGISSTKCIACHPLVEIGKDSPKERNSDSAKNKISFHQQLKEQKCTACHLEHKGLASDKAKIKFAHDLLSSSLRSDCNNCHGKPLDKIHTIISASCISCHNTNGWKSQVKFDHSLLQAADKNNCSSCHTKPDNLSHNKFTSNCNQCHNANKWVPSLFDHSKHFRFDNQHNAACVTCHPNNDWSKYTCYGCHKHNETKLAKKHNEHGIYNFNNCTACHRSGNEHEIERSGNSGEQTKQKELNGVKEYIKSTEKKGREDHEKKRYKDDDN